MVAEAMKAWLSKVWDDQNIKSIDDLPNYSMNGKRRWWRSQVLQPTINQGYYNIETGKYVLGIPSQTTGIAFTTASVATLTLTAAAGERLRVYYAGGVNITQASEEEMTVTIGGYTSAVPVSRSSANSQLDYNAVIAGFPTGAAVSGGPISELWLEPGDSMDITTTVFVGGNNTEKMILYQIYGV